MDKTELMRLFAKKELLESKIILKEKVMNDYGDFYDDDTMLLVQEQLEELRSALDLTNIEIANALDKDSGKRGDVLCTIKE